MLELMVLDTAMHVGDQRMLAYKLNRKPTDTGTILYCS